MPSVFTDYEQRVIQEIVLHKIQPSWIQRLLQGAGRPFGQLFEAGRQSNNRAIRGVSNRVQGWVEEGLIKTFHVANRLTSDTQVTRRALAQGLPVSSIESLRYLPLDRLDRVADSFKFRNYLMLGIEGILFGGATTLAESIPGAQLIIPSLMLTDITTSMTLLSRNTCQVATAYGFSSKQAGNLPHLIAAMAPHTDTGDEGYLALKTAVLTSIHESAQFMAHSASTLIDRQLLEREAPQMIRLIAYVADRLGVVFTEKQLGTIIPIAGAALNSSINLAFQQLGHQTAKDYFRRLILEERYGEELVHYAIAKELDAFPKRK